MRQPDSRQLLLNRIESVESQYSADIRMFRSPFNSPGYHTSIKQADFIHSTYRSLIYALGLLDTELECYEQRGFDIIGQVVSLQDTDRSRNTFGIWPWFYEEPLDQMSPPDWNWADFCGKLLVLALSRHGRRFPEPLRIAVEQAVCNACDAIMQRNVGPHYTNIAIMGSFVTLIAGEKLGRRDYAEYGLERLEKVHRYTHVLGAFQEYNSPTYTTVAILELSKIRTETVNDTAKQLSEDLLELAWKSVAGHFHAATRQWAGPHSRCYRTLLSDAHKAFLQIATAGKLSFFTWEQLPYDEEWYKSGISCPEPYVQSFLVEEIREIRQLYGRHETEGTEKWATTYMQPGYTLGSFSRDIMWNQTRVLLGYFDNGGQPAYMHLRCLHDGYDYCSAIFSSVQHQSEVLYGVHFIVDGGDTHPNLDRIDGVIEAADFRLRLEFGGCLQGVTAERESGEGAVIAIGERYAIRLRTLFTAFEDAQGEPGAERQWQWEITELNGQLGVDWVIYSGDRRAIDFRQLTKAAFIFMLQVEDSASEASESNPQSQVKTEGGRIMATVERHAQPLALSLPLRPV